MPLTETQNPHSGGGDEPPAATLRLRANRYDVLSRLADDLAHEIKNPLNAIVVNLEVLRRRIANGAADSALERVAVIEHEIGRLHGLIEQLLLLLRPGRTESKLLAVDAILDSLTEAIQIQAKAARVTFRIETEPDLYARVLADPFRFAVLNLLVYAIDAESAAGSVDVRAHRTADEIYIVVTCATAELSRRSDPVRICATLLRSAGAALESVEPNLNGVGSTATIILPSGGFV